jgi:hypothetical protein
MFKNAVVYAKGSWKSHTRLIFWDKNAITVRLERVFKKYPEKMAALDALFPDVFTNKRKHCAECQPTCKHRQTVTGTWCGYTDFRFEKPTHDDAMFIWELFKLENNIKPV